MDANNVLFVQLIMVDIRQDKIFVTRDEGVSFVGYDLDFTPDVIRYQKRNAPNVLEGDLPQHVTGYDKSTQEVHIRTCISSYSQLL